MPQAQSCGAFTLIPRGYGLVCTLATGASDLLAAGRLQLSVMESPRFGPVGATRWALSSMMSSSQVRAYA